MPWKILHYEISREKFEPESGFGLGPPDFLPGALPLELSWFCFELLPKSPS